MLVKLPEGFIFCEEDNEWFEIIQEIESDVERFIEDQQKDGIIIDYFGPKYSLSESVIL